MRIKRGYSAGQPGVGDEFHPEGVECTVVHDGGGAGDGGEVGGGTAAEYVVFHREAGGAWKFGGEFLSEFGHLCGVALVGGCGEGEEMIMVDGVS